LCFGRFSHLIVAALLFRPLHLFAGRSEILLTIESASRMSFDMIDHRAKLIEQRRVGARPVRMVIESGAPWPAFLISRSKNFITGAKTRPFAPAANPAVAAEHRYLQFFG
jgi:hypothetical protein